MVVITITRLVVTQAKRRASPALSACNCHQNFLRDVVFLGCCSKGSTLTITRLVVTQAKRRA